MTNNDSNQQKDSSPIKKIFMPSAIDRREFVGRNMAFFVVTSIALGHFSEDLENIPEHLTAPAYISISIISILFLLPFSIIPRMRDIGFNPFFSFLILIPGVNIVMGLMLLFSPGKHTKHVSPSESHPGRKSP